MTLVKSLQSHDLEPTQTHGLASFIWVKQFKKAFPISLHSSLLSIYSFKCNGHMHCGSRVEVSLSNIFVVLRALCTIHHICNNSMKILFFLVV